MIALDTNVLIRFLVRDDARQAQVATDYLLQHCTDEKPGWINTIVLCEAVWVLRRGYDYHKEDVIKVLEQLLKTVELEIEDRDTVRQAVRLYERTGVDFSDALIACRNRVASVSKTVTFDRKAAKLDDWHEL